MGGVGLQSADHLVVKRMGGVTERPLALQHDHRRAVGVSLLEHLADVFHRDHRRCRVGAHRHRLYLSDRFQLRHSDVEDGDGDQPPKDDRHREGTDHSGDERSRRVPVGRDGARRRSCPLHDHADFTKQ